MKKTTPLFRLVKSLTKNEKVYFKKFASQHVIGNKNNYVKLFEALDSLQEYDKKKLHHALKNESLLKHLAEAKYYLHKLILKSLCAFHSGSSIDARIREGLNSVEILYKKQLPEDASDLLYKIQKLAREHERSLSQIELLKWERRLSIEMDDIEKIEEFQKSFLKETKNLMEEEDTMLQNVMFSDAFLVFGIKYGLEETRHLKEVTALFNKLLPKMKKMEEQTLSFEAKRFLFNAYRQYYTLTGNLKSAYSNSVEFLKMIESNPLQIFASPRMYITTLHNHFLCLVLLERYDEAQATIRKIKAIPAQYSKPGDENVQLLILNVFHLELSLFHKMGRFREAVQQIEAEKIEEKLKLFRGKVNGQHEIVLCDNISWSYFMVGDFRSALKWINRLLNNTQLENIREHTHCLLRILNLMIHFELGNDEHIDHITKSTSLYLKKRQRLYKCESIFIEFLHRVFGTKSSERMAFFKALKKELASFKNDPEEHSIIEQLQINTWIDSKLNGRTFEEQLLKNMNLQK